MGSMMVIDMLIIMACGMIMAVICMIIGAFIMYKGKSSVPGEQFLGGVPKGQVFSIPEAVDIEDQPNDRILEKTEKFLSIFGR